MNARMFGMESFLDGLELIRSGSDDGMSCGMVWKEIEERFNGGGKCDA